MAKDIKKWCNLSYLANLPTWIKIRDCFDGEDAIKSRKEAYLPRLKAQSRDDYDNYLYRALFFPITGKTCSSMIGLAVAEPPKTTYSDLMSYYFQDTEQGYQFTEFYVTIFTEVVLMGRLGVLIDAPIVGSTQPVLCRYTAENIMKWEVDHNGLLSRLILREYKQVPGEEKFETKTVCVLRHCYIENGQYWVEELDEDLEPISGTFPVSPLFMGQPIDHIPFTCFGATGIHIDVDKPPMQDISTLNLSHYLTSADLEWGRHIVGLPTPVVSGVDSGTNLHIGGTAAWILPVVEAKAYYLEFQGLGLKSLETAMSDKVSLMATVSARLIDNSTRGSESADTVKLRYMSESASLIQIIGSIENGCLLMYNMVAKLLKTDPVTIQFSKEILGTGVSMTDMGTMFEAYLNGSISKETLVYNLRRLGAIDPNRTDEEELAAIRNPPPIPTPAATPAPAPKP
jgi:hypothetical protein